MRVLHLAPHYGGGVGTSVVGIIEAIPGTHTLLALEHTLDDKSILFRSRNDFNLVKFKDFFSDSIKQSTDLFIFHYWNSPVWEKLKEFAKFQIVGKSILLHHRNFNFSGHEVQSLANHFSKAVQSGFESRLLPSDWETVPTCRTLTAPQSIRKIYDRSGAVYLGTLSFKKVAECLDYRRLGKQRVETWQIYRALTGQSTGWVNHPATKMWRGYKQALLYYGICMCREWIKRGYNDTMLPRFEDEFHRIKPAIPLS